MKQLSALLLSHPRGAVQSDFPAFPVFPAESLVLAFSPTPNGLGVRAAEGVGLGQATMAIMAL